MIVSRTPFRVSLFGGGTDYPEWYRKQGGKVLSATIDKYCYVSCRALPTIDGTRYRVVHSDVELARDMGSLRHPVFREALRAWGGPGSIEIVHSADLPGASGLGTSSALAVGLIHSLRALRGEHPEPASLALDAIRLEREMLGEPVGSQDQIAAAFGGFNRIELGRDGSFEVRPFELPAERLRELESHLFLILTGIPKSSREVASETIRNIPSRERELERISKLVEEGQSLLASSSFSLGVLGELLHESWMIKRALATGVSSPVVDLIYETARRAGASGGKILGTGGGGCMLFVAPPERHEPLREALRDLVHVPFRLDGSGSRILIRDQGV